MFEPINSNNLKQEKTINTNRVIKNSKVAVNKKFVIEPKEVTVPKPVAKTGSKPVAKTDNSKKIEPIVKDDRIIGIKYRCDCGKVEDILFEFEE